MSAVAISRPVWRARSATIAHVLAIALVAAIPIANSVTTVLSILLPLACILYMDNATWGRTLRNPTTITILLLVLVSIFAITYSIGTSKDIALGLRKNTRLLYFMFALPLFAELKWRNYANIAYLCAVFASVVAAMIYTWTFFKDPIFTSLFVSYGIFMCAHLIFEYKKYRFVTIPLAIFCTFYLFFIGTGRVGQLLFFMFAALFMWQRFKLTRRAILPMVGILGLLIASICLLPSSFIDRQKLALHELQEYAHTPHEEIFHESSLGIRLVLAYNTWELIKQKPILGWGTGSYREAYANYAPETRSKEIKRTNPHNQYLLMWMELGLPGLALLLALFGTLIWTFWHKPGLDGYLGLGLTMAFIIGCTMNSWLLDVTSCFFFAVMTAVYAGATDCLKRSNRVN